MANDVIDSLTSILINLLYTLLTTALVSFFLQKFITLLVLPWLYEAREIIRIYEKQFAKATNNTDYLLRPRHR
jgi:hypothetical protein